MLATHVPARSIWMRLALGVLVVAALAGIWRFTPLADLLDRDRIAAWAGAVRETPWAPLALVAAYTPAAFLLFPRPVLTLLAVIAFGRWAGFGYAMSGILISAIAAYYAGRLLPLDKVQRYAGRYLEPATKALQRHGLLAVFMLRVVPTAPHAVASALAGALRVKAWHFIVGTFLGMLPGVLAATVFGGEIAAALDDSAQVSYWLAGAALLVLALTVWGLHRWLRAQA